MEAGFKKLKPDSPLGLLSQPMLTTENMSPELTATATMPVAISQALYNVMDSYAPGTVSPDESFLLKVALVIAFYHNNRKAAVLINNNILR